MYKRLAFAFIILYLFSAVCYAADNSSRADKKTFNDDYFVGLKAFDDGLKDVSKSCLENYLTYDNKTNKAGFALYLLYQIYTENKDFSKAKETLNRASLFKDNRFDKSKMAKDRMLIETSLNCADAEKLLTAAPSDEYMEVYTESKCSINKPIIELAKKYKFSPDVIYLLLNKIKDNKELMLTAYKSLDNYRNEEKLNNFFGKYFYANNMRDEFYKLYEGYKDEELVSYVLNELWQKKDYKKYIESFNSSVKPDYKMDKAVYCRMIEASNKQTLNFDCELVDKCLGTASPDYNKTKLACFMRKEDKKNIELFINKLPEKETVKLCEYGKYIIGKNLYSSSFVNKFANCPDKVSMYESLLKFKDYKSAIILADKGNTQIDIAYLAISYYFSNNKEKYEETLKKLNDIDLAGMVKRTISKGNK